MVIDNANVLQVAALSGGRRLTVRFRPSKRALGKLTEGHPDARDSPAVPQLRFVSCYTLLYWCKSIVASQRGSFASSQVLEATVYCQ